MNTTPIQELDRHITGIALEVKKKKTGSTGVAQRSGIAHTHKQKTRKMLDTDKNAACQMQGQKTMGFFKTPVAT